MSTKDTPVQSRLHARKLPRYTPGCVALLISCVGLIALLQLGAATAASAIMPDAPEQGLVYADLMLDQATCPGDFRIKGTNLCTHGPDAAPPSVDVQTSVRALPAVRRGESSTHPYCDGDGTSGKRVQIMYVRAADRPDRYLEYVESIRAWSAEMDEIFDISAQATGGRRRIRFVTDDQCQVDVLNVVAPAAADDTLRATIKALRTLGYNSVDRKYVMFVDANVYCGIATALNDSSPSPENRNNMQPGFARIDSGCWSGANAAHELVHLLGGVQQDAPNASGGWHCTDEFDLLCYSDTPDYPTMRYLCPLDWEELLDCNHDDYFHSNPAPGSYLATHWNVANSAFLLVLPADDGAVGGQDDHTTPVTTPVGTQIFLPLVTSDW